jgi:CheY-like chemotaxis protein
MGTAAASRQKHWSILVVDDRTDAEGGVAHALREIGYDVAVAPAGLTAYFRLLHGRTANDVGAILVVVHDPGLDALGFLRLTKTALPDLVGRLLFVKEGPLDPDVESTFANAGYPVADATGRRLLLESLLSCLRRLGHSSKPSPS